MNPSKPEPTTIPLYALGLIGLLAVALVLAVAKTQERETREELRLERAMRDRLQERLAKREEQLDGALAHIKSNGNDPEHDSESVAAGE